MKSKPKPILNIRMQLKNVLLFNRLVYRCAKTSRWGDLLPIDIQKETSDEINLNNTDNELLGNSK